MASAFASAAATMLHPATRGLADEGGVSLTPFGGAAVPIAAYFAAEYTREVMGADGIPVSATSPALGPIEVAYLDGLGITADELSHPDSPGTATVGATTYRIDDVQPDGVGAVMLILSV